MSNKSKIIDGLSNAIGFAKGDKKNTRVTVYNSNLSEFFQEVKRARTLLQDASFAGQIRPRETMMKALDILDAVIAKAEPILPDRESA